MSKSLLAEQTIETNRVDDRFASILLGDKKLDQALVPGRGYDLHAASQRIRLKTVPIDGAYQSKLGCEAFQTSHIRRNTGHIYRLA